MDTTSRMVTHVYLHGAAPVVRPVCNCSVKTSRSRAQGAPQAVRRRAILLSTVFPLAAGAGARAAGIESIQLPFLKDPREATEAARAKMEQEAAAFEGSDFLKGLRERSALSRDKNKKDLLEKYCYRQAEMGVGDCAGLRLIPGATKSGLQKEKTPERKFLEFILGNKEE